MDTSTLPPTDAAVAVRSFPRRFRDALASDEGGGFPRALIEAPGPGGRSAAELIADTTRSLALIDRALEQTLVTDHPLLHAATMRRAERAFVLGAGDTAETLLAELSDVASRFANCIEAVPTADWTRPAGVVGSPDVDALDLVREAVSTGADNLRELQHLITELS